MSLKSIAFQSSELELQKLRERLREMSDEELIKFGKMVRRLSAPRVSPGWCSYKRHVRSGVDDILKFRCGDGS